MICKKCKQGFNPTLFGNDKEQLCYDCWCEKVKK